MSMKVRRTRLQKFFKWFLRGTPKIVTLLGPEKVRDVIGIRSRRRVVRSVKLSYCKRIREYRSWRFWVPDYVTTDWVITCEVKHSDGYTYEGEYRYRESPEEEMVAEIVKISVEDSLLKKALEFPNL